MDALRNLKRVNEPNPAGGADYGHGIDGVDKRAVLDIRRLTSTSNINKLPCGGSVPSDWEIGRAHV